MTRKFTKLSVLFLMITVFVFAGFGCKGLSTTEKKATKTVELEYWTVEDDVGALNALIAKYKALRPFLRITVRQLGENEIYSRLVEELAEDRGPDIISVSNRELPKYLSKLQPMPASVEDTTMQTVKKTIGTETLVNINTVYLPTIDQITREYVQTVAKDAIISGNVYGLPLSLETLALYYNKDLLDRSGVPEPPKNWDEFQEAVKKINRYNANGEIIQSGVALGSGKNVPAFDDILYALFEQTGVSFVARTGQAVFNNTPKLEGGVSSATNIINFYTDFANSTRDTYAWNKDLGSALDRFAQGSVGFMFGFSYHNNLIKARSPQLNYEILPMLQINPDRPANGAKYWLQTVNKKSANKEEAWAFINFITHSEANKTYLDRTGRPTALRTYISDQSKIKALEPFTKYLLVADNWYRGTNYKAAKQALSDMLDEWLAPAPDPDKVNNYRNSVLNRAVSKINQTL